jgi:cytochrome c biogenesis protein ResB
MLVPEFEVLILLILASAIVGMISSTRARDERIWLNTLISSEPFPSLPIFP